MQLVFVNGVQLNGKPTPQETVAPTPTVQRGHVGSVKQRRNFGPLTITRIQVFEGHYGEKWWYHFEDKSGNVLLWKGSKEVDWLVDAYEGQRTVTIKATVKEHGDYNGTPQTLILRVAKP